MFKEAGGEQIFWTCAAACYLLIATIDALTAASPWWVLVDVVGAIASTYWAVEANVKARAKKQ
jgi:Flp pilus assembly protein TadB